MRDVRGWVDHAEDEEADLSRSRAAGKVSLTSRIAARDDAPDRHAAMAPHPLAVPVQLSAAGAVATGAVDDAFALHQIAARGVAGDAGGPLPHLETIQASFGHHDVRDVRAHVGGSAGDAASAIGAHGYATGDDVAFAAPPELRLAAHEAAHVVQQRGGVRLSGGVGTAGDPYERHADAVADRVVRGESAEALLDEMAHRGGAGGRAVQRDGNGRDAASRRAAPAREPRTRDGQPIREGDALIPGTTAGATAPDPDTHVTGTGGGARNASQRFRNPANPDDGVERNPDFAPEEGSRPPLNPYEGDQTTSDPSTPLFDERGANYDDVQQGDLGDCYLLAALSAVAQMDPARIRRMVTELGDGRYSVTFWVARREGRVLTFNPHQEIVTNEVPTTTGGDPSFGGAPAQRTPGGFRGAGQRELWVSIVERAYAQWRGGYREAGNGGYGDVALEELTGTRSQSYDPRTMDPEEIIRIVERALRDGAPVIASTACDDAVAAEHGLFSPHAYSVLSAGSGAMLVRNQHNRPTRGGRRVRVDAATLRTCFQQVSISGARAGAPVNEGPAAPEDGETAPGPSPEPDTDAGDDGGDEAQPAPADEPAAQGELGPIALGQLGEGARRRRRGGGERARAEGDGGGDGAAADRITVRTAAPAPDGAGFDRSTVGVGEHMTFTAPGGRSGAWTASAGRPRSGSGSTFAWVAPPEAGAVTITFAGGTTRELNVIAPSGVEFANIGDLAGRYAPTEAGAGMALRVQLRPYSVSFGALLVREIGDGEHGAARGVTGYFANPRFNRAELRHAPTAGWADITDSNFTNTAAGQGDTAATRPGRLPRIWSDGRYFWRIPYHYRTQGESGAGREFAIVHQTFRIHADGTVIVAKGNERVSRTPSGAGPQAAGPQASGD